MITPTNGCLAVSTAEGRLRIVADLPIPNAEAGQWTPARLAKLMSTIEKAITDTAAIAEVVDAAAQEPAPRWRAT
jgi:hypothetical protein